MTRSILLITVMSAAGLVTIHLRDDLQEQQPITKEVTEFDDPTTELVENYRVFKSTLAATLKELSDRHVDLATATARIHSVAKKHSPIYLDRVCVSDPGATPEERIARNLIGHLVSLEEVEPELAPRIAELKVEFQGTFEVSLSGVDPDDQ